ncbi:MAG: MBL fold metallo-hydrolase [Candidatus Omnitrophica bacterium]|nr:MBL fold metallo-hydrolase [Candidatus Omnitrophota bacterium]
MILETVVVGPLQVNCYILAKEEGKPAIIIDPGAEPDKIKKVLANRHLTAGLVVNTHGHFDHIGADDAFGVPVAVGKEDAFMLLDAAQNFSLGFASPVTVRGTIRKLHDGQLIEIYGISLRVLHIPGHTPGGIALVLEATEPKICFSGDSLFYESIGRTDLGGDEGTLLDAVRNKILILPKNTLIYPGHGPSTTVGHELRYNPFFNHQ